MLTPAEQDAVVREVVNVIKLARQLDTRVRKVQIDPRTAKRSLEKRIEQLRDSLKDLG